MNVEQLHKALGELMEQDPKLAECRIDLGKFIAVEESLMTPENMARAKENAWSIRLDFPISGIVKNVDEVCFVVGFNMETESYLLKFGSPEPFS